jgi:hypothetical protein
MTSVAKYADEKITLTADGRWLHGSVEITHERTRELFFKSIGCRGGKFFLAGEKTPVPIVVEDTPYFVRRWEHGDSGWGTIVLSDGERESLAPATLDVGRDDRFYCRVKEGRFPALFDRSVYYELAKNLTEKDGFYGLVRDGAFYPLKRKGEPSSSVPVPSVKKSAQTSAPRVNKTAKIVSPVKTSPKKPVAKLSTKLSPAKSKKPVKKAAAKSTAKSVAKTSVKTKKSVKKPAKKKR